MMSRGRRRTPRLRSLRHVPHCRRRSVQASPTVAILTAPATSAASQVPFMNHQDYSHYRCPIFALRRLVAEDGRGDAARLKPTKVFRGFAVVGPRFRCRRWRGDRRFADAVDAVRCAIDLQESLAPQSRLSGQPGGGSRIE